MARHLHSRLKVKGELIAETPFHVGGYGESFETDMALARNGRDEFYVPGTSLTGSLRSWFRNAFGDNEMESLFGNEQADFASFVLIEDLSLPEDVQSELRDGVGIDRFYGTAADKAKFDRAILPKNTRLNFEMTVEIQSDEKKTKAMFGHTLDALTKGNIRLGAAKTRGLGRVKLELKSIEEYLLNNFDSILDVIEEKPTAKYSIDSLKTEDTTITPTGSQLLTITISWQPKSALMVKAAYEGIGVDTLPLTSGIGKGQVSLVLPGSSIKGAFRAQAERIMRTLLYCEDKTNPEYEENKKLETKGKEFHEQISLELVNQLFGAKKERTGPIHLGLGALSFDDCYASKKFNANVWGEVETGELKNDETYSKQSLWEALRKVDLNTQPDKALTEEEKAGDTQDLRISHHVAIDRWTGGASEGALFSVLEPSAAFGWEDISLTLDLKRIPLSTKEDGSPDDSARKRCLMLLLLVIRDLAENRLPLGFATNRGMGEVVIKKIDGLERIPELIGMQGESFGAEIIDQKVTFNGDSVKGVLKGVWFK